MATAPQLKIVKPKQARTQEGATHATNELAQTYSYFSEDPRAQFLFVDTDERGQPTYFFQMNITGLRNRMFAPYVTRSLAIESFDSVLLAALEAFCEMQRPESTFPKGNNGMEHIALPALTQELTAIQ